MAKKRTSGVTVDVGELCKGLDLDLKILHTKAIPEAMVRIGSMMEEYAKDTVPVKTGHLRESITHLETVTATGYMAEVGSNMEYAPYVEYGTGDTGRMSGGASYYGHVEPITYTAGWPGVRARPYLRPAVYDLEDVYVEMVREAVRGALR